LLLAPVVVLAACADDPGAAIGSPAGDPPVVAHGGVLVFRDNQAVTETIAQLGALDAAGVRAWNQRMGIVSLRQVFDDVVAAESAIDDDYERLASDPATAGLVPSEPVHSAQYVRALRGGQFHIADDPEGGYFDYSIQNPYLAPVLDASGRVAIGDVVFQYGPAGVKQGRFTGLGGLDRAFDDLVVAPVLPGARYAIGVPTAAARRDGGIANDDCVCLPNTQADWLYASVVGNGWSTHGRRRYRAWIEGESHRLFDPDLQPQLYVRNVLRIQGMKKNLLGQWGFRETYSVTVDIAWIWQYAFNGVFSSSLPVPGDSSETPLSWSSGFVNNATLPLSPHIDGHYQFGCVDCVVEPVLVSAAGGTVVIAGVALDPSVDSQFHIE
jgi:hypothetical protein